MNIRDLSFYVSTKPKENWSFLDKKVPKEFQDCWVCQYDNEITRGEYIYHELFGSGFGSNEEFIEEIYVKCWMPYYTPEPPNHL